jgi:hypothetical protein
MLRSLATAYMIPTAVSAGAAAAPERPPVTIVTASR